jgi:predicted transcriptional regulator
VSAIPPFAHLSRRERQIMDVVHARGSATVAEIVQDLPEAPTPTAVRTMLRTLERKGHLRREQDGLRSVFHATQPGESLKSSMLQYVVGTFFRGESDDALVALLGMGGSRLSPQERDRLLRMIEDARSGGADP